MNKFIFPMRQNIMVIPYWVAAVIRRKNMKMEDLLNFQKAQEVLAENDIKSMLAAHRFAEDIFPAHLLKSNGSPFWEWWFQNDSTTEGRKKIEELSNQVKLDPNFFKDQQARMFAKTTNNLDVYISKSDPEKGFEVVALRDQAVGVILYNSLRDRLDYRAEVQYEMLHDIVKLLYAYEHPTQVNSTRVYGMYLETLYSRKAVLA